MRIETVEIAKAEHGILIHNISDGAGHKRLPKGRRLSRSDIDILRQLGKERVQVGIFEPGDVGENEAALRIARAVAGTNVELSSPSGGRVNLLSAVRGVLELRVDALTRINLVKGVTLATIPDHAVVDPRKMVATVKTIGLAVPDSSLAQVETLAQQARELIGVRALRPVRVAIILTGTAEARARVENTFVEPIESRVRELGASVLGCEYVEHEPNAGAAALSRALHKGAECVIIAGETSIMDESDVTPTAIRQAGGTIEVYGAPVEPGNLLLLAYAGVVPIVGAPGCVKSRDTNVVDLILPRLFAGEHVSRADVVALANGGLLI